MRSFNFLFLFGLLFRRGDSPLELGDEPSACSASSTPSLQQTTHHFMLAHRHPSIPMRTIICTLPLVKNNSARNTHSSVAKAPSRMSRNVGWRDDPGVRICETKPALVSTISFDVVSSVETIWVSEDMAGCQGSGKSGLASQRRTSGHWRFSATCSLACVDRASPLWHSVLYLH